MTDRTLHSEQKTACKFPIIEPITEISREGLQIK